ncbi:MAG: AAA family ATPase, partial [Pirellulaceae bacterium]|nr:AAA family ATPase [Pirellulaceae bacterium]
MTDTQNRAIDTSLEDLLRRIERLSEGEPESHQDEECNGSPSTGPLPTPELREEKVSPEPPVSPRSSSTKAIKGQYYPREPDSLEETGLNPSEVESLILKFLLTKGDASGRDVVEQIKLPYKIVEPLLQALKHNQHLAYRSAAEMGDYVYALTEIGREKAKRLSEHCTYFGTAPVSVEDYLHSIEKQALEDERPGPQELKAAFSDLFLSEEMLFRLGPAVNSGRGLFLYGAPGNGKTSIAERIAK